MSTGHKARQPSLSGVEDAAGTYYHSPIQQGIDNRIKSLIVERCVRHLKGPEVLDLGYIDGLWTDAILGAGHRVHIVEGASRHVEHARERYKGRAGVRVTHSLFETFQPEGRFDSVVAGDMLSCLEDPEALLVQCRSWLKPDGALIVTVPNSRSLHRRIGALMGFESTPNEVNEQYRAVGNRWSYDRYLLRHQLVSAGYTVTELRGCFLKPLTSPQLEDAGDELLRGLLEVGDELEDYCYYVYAVATQREA
jgi:2-polyprenyl-3-methyl-5-hydroxy-6-metoxy-1,4-benzoquinol methylase